MQPKMIEIFGIPKDSPKLFFYVWNYNQYHILLESRESLITELYKEKEKYTKQIKNNLY